MASAALVFLQDLTIVIGAAALATILFHRLGQPVILGYILAGVLVGPHLAPIALVQDLATIEILGEIGIVFLLFGLGLEFHLGKLRKVGATAVVSGVLRAGLMVWLGYVVGRAFGLDAVGAVFLGAVVSISSTVVVAKILEEYRQQDEPWAQIVLGILVVEDIIAILILTALSADLATGGAAIAGLGGLFVKLALFVVTALVLGLLLVPHLVSWVARFPVQEVLVVTVVALAFGLSLLGAYLGFSVALGAFVMGALIAESPASRIVHRRIFPIRDLFTAIFFVAVGMLVDPLAVIEHWRLVAVVAVVVVVGKVVFSTFTTMVAGHDLATSLRVGFGLAQIGEFSFVIATAAVGLTQAPLFPVVVAVAAITAFTTPALIRVSPRAVRGFERVAPRPLLTFARLYGAWIARLRTAGGGALRPLAGPGIRTAVAGACTLAILVAGSAAADRVASAFSAYTARVVAEVLAWIAVALLTLPFAVLSVKGLRAFVDAVSDVALPEAMRASPTGRTARRVVRRTFTFTAALLAGALVLVLATTVTPSPFLVGAVVAGVGLATFFLADGLLRFQRRIDAVVGSVVEGETPAERDDVLRLIRESYPLSVEVVEVPVPPSSWCVGRRLRDVGLRSATGASVVAVERAGRRHVNPDPEWTLAGGDVLLVLGEADQTSAVTAFIASPSPPPPAEGILVRAGSPLQGATLAGARIRERTGATVVGIIRGEVRLDNPSPDLGIEAGDRLLALGEAAHVDALRALAEGSVE